MRPDRLCRPADLLVVGIHLSDLRDLWGVFPVEAVGGAEQTLITTGRYSRYHL